VKAGLTMFLKTSAILKIMDTVLPGQVNCQFGPRFFLVSAILILSSCANEIFRNAVPAELEEVVGIADMSGVRAWGDSFDLAWQADIIQSIRDEPEGLFLRGPNGEFQYSGLTLSGGGEHGAFGAGYVKGWSASGTRPPFKVVTGISTGALIAPFALLGPEYDDTLEEVYTQITADDIYRKESILGAYWRESLADNQPLRNMVGEYVTDEVIDAIGQAHNDGQRLLIGTTNFDAQRTVIWNMGAGANVKQPEAYQLFRDIMVASAAVPILFPPTFIEVEYEDETYEEMHVDGGTMGQMVFLGSTIHWKAALQEVSGEAEPVDNSVVYIIVNGDIDQRYDATPRRLAPIAIRTIETMIKASALSSLYKLYWHAKINGYDFKYVSLPANYEPLDDTPYDPEEMRRMFRIGHEMGEQGDSWSSTPPEL
jgi:hypothetical protein